MTFVIIKREPIKQYLRVRNKNQRWFADQIGVSQYYLSLLLNGKRQPSPRLRETIVFHFGRRGRNDDERMELWNKFFEVREKSGCGQ